MANGPATYQGVAIEFDPVQSSEDGAYLLNYTYFADPICDELRAKDFVRRHTLRPPVGWKNPIRRRSIGPLSREQLLSFLEKFRAPDEFWREG